MKKTTYWSNLFLCLGAIAGIVIAFFCKQYLACILIYICAGVLGFVALLPSIRSNATLLSGNWLYGAYLLTAITAIIGGVVAYMTVLLFKHPDHAMWKTGMNPRLRRSDRQHL
jgi:hypothetical protein